MPAQSDPEPFDSELGELAHDANKEMNFKSKVIPVERKLQIIMTELSYAQEIIKHEMDQKTKSRTWAVTSFSAIFALSMHQINENILLLIIPAIVLFWFIDATRQGTHSIMVERSNEIQVLLRNPTDDALLTFQSPMFGEHLTNRKIRDKHTLKAIFRRLRVIFYGSMISGAIVMYIAINIYKY